MPAKMKEPKNVSDVKAYFASDLDGGPSKRPLGIDEFKQFTANEDLRRQFAQLGDQARERLDSAGIPHSLTETASEQASA